MVKYWNGLTFIHYRIAPAPTPGARIGRFVAVRHFFASETVRCAERCRHFGFAEVRLRQHARAAKRDRRSRQRDIGKFLVLEGKLDALDLLVRARAHQALGEVTPVRCDERTWTVVRAGCCGMRA